MGSSVRLDRVLANLGYATRREAGRLVRDGRVTVAGTVVRDPSHHARPDEVGLDGEPLDHPDGILVALHKPVGVVCSHDDREGERVYDLLPEHWAMRNPAVVSIGRLDKDSSGLLLLTDHAGLVHELASPRRHVEKRYVVGLDEPWSPEELAAHAATFASGTLVLRGEDSPCLPAVLRGTDDPSVVEIVLTEGRHRQVRRMVAACGRHVEQLRREAMGPYELGDLAERAWRDVDPSLLPRA